MLDKNTLFFLKKLKENNNKQWMDENKYNYELSKQNFLEFVQQILIQLIELDKRFEYVNPKQCIFRINKDIRFSKDKTPYKTNWGAVFSLEGKKTNKACFYLHIEPSNSFVGGGLWKPEGAILKKIRQEIYYETDTFLKIIKNKKFSNFFGDIESEDKLKKTPTEFLSNQKAPEYLKFKSFVVSKKLSDEDILNPNLINSVLNSFKTAEPLIHFLNKNFDDET